MQMYFILNFSKKHAYAIKIFRAARYSKINLNIVLSCLNVRDNNRYNISIPFSMQYQDCGVNDVNNLVLS